jgi:hypothetical protein
LRRALVALGCLGLVAWAAGYLYIAALACAFGGQAGSCPIPLPWTLRGEDLMLLVLLPAAVVAVAFALAWWLGRR